MSKATDFLLRRRYADFYLGKVMRLSEQTAPQGDDGHGPGYYRMTETTPDYTRVWYEYLGTEMPKGEPVYDYHTPLQRDIWAIPSTCFPKTSFWVWTAIAWPLILLGLINGDGGALICLWPMWALGWGYKWMSNIEPVWATKTLGIWLAIWVLWTGHSQKGDRELANGPMNQNKLLGL